MEILLSTRLGTPVANLQGAEIDPRRRPFLRQALRAYGSLELRSPETGQYNCHGLVFASRRTRIVESSLVELILREDGYRRIDEDQAMEGDLVIYRNEDEIMHTAVVTEVGNLGPGRPRLVLKVLSKWGDHAEYFHHPANVPNYFGEREVWTERPER
jgi:hypothetical protein